MLFDAVVLADGEGSVNALARLGQTLEFLTNQYRHCKTLMAIGASSVLFERAGVAAQLPSGEADSGVLTASGGDIGAKTEAFIDAVSKHRHTAREMDPPPV